MELFTREPPLRWMASAIWSWKTLSNKNVTPPMDDIQEVKVSGSGSSGDIGVFGGAQVNAVIKSGTNQIHGSAFEFFRNQALNANSWSNDFNGIPKAPYRANQ